MLQNKPKAFAEGTLTYVPLKVILDHDDIPNRPLDREWVDNLCADITRNGLDTPLLVWNGGGDKGKQVETDDGKHVPAAFLVSGAHRRAALRTLMKKDSDRYKELFPEGVPVVVRGGDIKDALCAQLRENVQRKDMPAEQIFPVLKVLREDHEMKQKEIARSIGKSEAWVSQIFDIEDELGEEGVEELKKGNIKLSDAREATRKMKLKKKKGEKVSAKDELEEVKSKKQKLKDKGRVREEKRVSAKKIWARYLAMPKLTLGTKINIAESALGYLAGDEEYELPEELSVDAEEEAKAAKKKSRDEDEDDGEDEEEE